MSVHGSPVSGPRLIAVAGPLEGETFEIGPEPFSIGRQSANRLQLRHESVSRRHCVLRRTGDGVVLCDLDSLCGTFVNGIPVRERRLEHRDFVTVGDSLLLFLARSEDAEEPGPGPALEEAYTADSTVEMPVNEALYLRRVRDAELAHDMVGESPAMKKVLELVARVAPSDLTVLVLGESGTGKELVSKAIHRNSPRAEKPFVAISCATLSETLLESELFGHEKGAFTGAVGRKTGQLELADGGTVLLDEVGEIPVALQAKLLRVLETREFQRVGGTRTVRVDVRVVAATNRDLEAAIRDGTFREDLYHRLNVFALTLPPLRERLEDVALLANHFVARFARRLNRPLRGLTPRARRYLAVYDWPGNVRELKNALERAAVLAAGELIGPEDLPEAVLESNASADGTAGTYHEMLYQTKRRILAAALRDAGGSTTEAAKRLGLNRTYLHRLIRNLKLRDELEE